MTIAIHKTDLRMFSDLYQALLELVDDPRGLEMLIKCKTFEEFKARILHGN